MRTWCTAGEQRADTIEGSGTHLTRNVARPEDVSIALGAAGVVGNPKVPPLRIDAVVEQLLHDGALIISHSISHSISRSISRSISHNISSHSISIRATPCRLHTARTPGIARSLVTLMRDSMSTPRRGGRLALPRRPMLRSTASPQLGHRLARLTQHATHLGVREVGVELAQAALPWRAGTRLALALARPDQLADVALHWAPRRVVGVHVVLVPVLRVEGFGWQTVLEKVGVVARLRVTKKIGIN